MNDEGCHAVRQNRNEHDAERPGAEGVGLFRTEFMFLNRKDLPGEEEQFAAYREA